MLLKQAAEADHVLAVQLFPQHFNPPDRIAERRILTQLERCVPRPRQVNLTGIQLVLERLKNRELRPLDRNPKAFDRRRQVLQPVDAVQKRVRKGGGMGGGGGGSW